MAEGSIHATPLIAFVTDIFKSDGEKYPQSLWRNTVGNVGEIREKIFRRKCFFHSSELSVAAGGRDRALSIHPPPLILQNFFQSGKDFFLKALSMMMMVMVTKTMIMLRRMMMMMMSRRACSLLLLSPRFFDV